MWRVRVERARVVDYTSGAMRGVCAHRGRGYKGCRGVVYLAEAAVMRREDGSEAYVQSFLFVVHPDGTHPMPLKRSL